MSATITWTIQWMNTSTQTINGFSDVVLECGWNCNGTETAGTPPTTYSNNIYGTCSFVPPQAGDPNFVPYNQLTQAQVLSFCYANGVNQAATEATVNSNINLLINPTQQQLPLPWAAAPVAPAAAPASTTTTTA
jgi:hypothetical protein